MFMRGPHDPLRIERAEGPWLYASNGLKILDAGGGAVVVNIGQGRCEIAEVAARTIANLDYIVPVWTSPERERLVERLSRWTPAGLTRFFFTSGGSEANYTAMLCALTRAHPEFAADGARAFAGPPVFYTSKECHRSWVKIAHQAGIGRSAARLVATDGTGRMSAAALAAAIEADLKSGCTPEAIRQYVISGAATVEDVLARRTRALFLNARAAFEMAPRVAELMARELRQGGEWESAQVRAVRLECAAFVPKG